MKNLLRAIALALALGIAPMGGALAQDKGGPAAEAPKAEPAPSEAPKNEDGEESPVRFEGEPSTSAPRAEMESHVE